MLVSVSLFSQRDNPEAWRITDGIGQGGTIANASESAMQAALERLPGVAEEKPVDVVTAAEQAVDAVEKEYRLQSFTRYKELLGSDAQSISDALGDRPPVKVGEFFRSASVDDIAKVMHWIEPKGSTPPEELVNVPMQELSPAINMTGAEARKELAGRVVTPEIIVAALADTDNTVIVESLFIDGKFYPGTLNDFEAKVILRYMDAEKTGGKQ